MSVDAPYYVDEYATLYHGDCREVLPTIKRETIGLLATDPPYGIGYQSTRRLDAPHATIEGDDGSLDVVAIIGEAVRALRRHRHVYVFGLTALALAAAPSVASPVDLTWDKGSPGMGDWTALYGPSTEPIAFGVYEPSRAQRSAGSGAGIARLRRGTVYRCPRLSSGQNDDHPTGKPVALMRQIIEASSVVGDIVLDPFAGAGATLVASVVSGRQTIGIELDERYCERAARRLREARKLRLALEALG